MISTEDGKRLADNQDILFIETSAKSDININKAFTEMAHLILEKVSHEL